MNKWVITVVAVGALAAGGSAPAAAQQTEIKLETKPKKPKSGGANLITQEEIEYSKATTALEAIERVRPSMLRVRMGAASDQGEAVMIKVYLDNILQGDPETLRSLEATRVKEIRYLNATDATQLKGTGHTAGAIMVTTKR